MGYFLAIFVSLLEVSIQAILIEMTEHARIHGTLTIQTDLLVKMIWVHSSSNYISLLSDATHNKFIRQMAKRRAKRISRSRKKMTKENIRLRNVDCRNERSIFY